MLVPIFPTRQFSTLRGLGDTPAATQGFVEGVTAWQSPGTAFQSLTSPVGKPVAYLAGLALPILGVVLFGKSLMGKRR